MTGRELLMGMTDLDGSILAEAEAFRTEIPVRRFRPALAAATGIVSESDRLCGGKYQSHRL